jgi:hypothetical protein
MKNKQILIKGTFENSWYIFCWQIEKLNL